MIRYSGLMAKGIVCSAFFISAANADITFNGFATIAGGQTFDDDVEYHNMDGDLAFDQLSLIALQARADLGEGLTATAQLVARGTNDFDGEFEWAYLGYQATENLNIRAGRVRLPTYYYSEFLDVSYAYHWLTPPIEVYASNVTSYDGISFYYSGNTDAIDYSLQVGHGSRTLDLENIGEFEGNYDLVVNADVTYEMWSTKLIYFSGDSTLRNPTFAQLQTLFPEPEYAGAIDVNETGLTILGLASYLTVGDSLLGVEMADLDFDGVNFVLGDEERFMLTGVYTMGSVALHYSYSTVDGITDFALINAQDPRFAVVRGLAANAKEVTTHTVGLRYDFLPSAAFKIDVGTTEDDFNNTDTGFVRTGVALVF